MQATPKSEVPLDVEAAIAEFLNDCSRTLLELPPMAAGLRKHVKAIADRHPELTCESFGLGTERRTHIFKRCSAAGVGESSTGSRGAGDEGARTVSVKNTFIDDWVSPGDGDGGLEPVVFRSMPTQLPQGVQLPSLLTSCNKLDLSPINEGSPKWPRDGGPAADASPGAGPAAAARRGSEKPGPEALCARLERLRVRNTFIHIDSTEPDERSVRSMPHDMFRRCLDQEEAKFAPESTATYDFHVDVPDTPTWSTAPVSPCDAAMEARMFVPGMHVAIHGLTKIPAFNGRNGIVERFDQATGRYSIRLTTGSSEGPKHAKLKAENMRLAAPLLASPLSAFAAAPAYFGTFGAATSGAGTAGVSTSLKLMALV